MSLRHIATTNRFVCAWEFLWKSLSLQQNFVAATCCKKSNQTESVRLVAVTKFCCRDKDFHKISAVHTKRFVAAMCRRNMLLQLVAGPVHTEWSVAATFCCNLSPSAYRPLLLFAHIFEIFRITLTANGNLYKWPNKYTFIPSFFHKKYFTQFLICLSPTFRNCQLEADVRRLPVIVILNLSIIGWLLHTARVLISHKLRCCCPLPQWVVGAPPTASTGFKLLPLFSFSLLRQLTKRQTTRLAEGYRPASARWKLACEQALWERKACAQTSFF